MMNAYLSNYLVSSDTLCLNQHKLAWVNCCQNVICLEFNEVTTQTSQDVSLLVIYSFVLQNVLSQSQ